MIETLEFWLFIWLLSAAGGATLGTLLGIWYRARKDQDR